MGHELSIGLARMHKEPGERRDFLPNFVALLEQMGAKVLLEYGYGSGMQLVEDDYLQAAPSAAFACSEEIYQQDFVMVLRYPSNGSVGQMRPGACLISMIHYPTRPERVKFLRSLGIEAISLDSLKDDIGRRLVENLRSVAWNGIEAAFRVLQSTYPPPGFGSPDRPPIMVTLMGAGSVGTHVVQAAIHYGDNALRKRMASAGIPGVQVTAIDYDVTPHEALMKNILADTDMLVDATQRPDPSQYVIPNEWVGYLPQHAVLLDLSVDPYNCNSDLVSVKGIEGIPQGTLDKFTFMPDDPAYEQLPECVSTVHRRHAVSCYSWPGVYPKKCMTVYGRQIQPIMRKIMDKGGVEAINPSGSYFERAISRAMLSRWVPQNNNG